MVSEPWAFSTQPPVSLSSASGIAKSQPPSHTQWQAHWLELRIHALKQQQQRYALKLQQLQSQGQQDASSHQKSDLQPTREAVPNAAHHSNTAETSLGRQTDASQVGVAQSVDGGLAVGTVDPAAPQTAAQRHASVPAVQHSQQPSAEAAVGPGFNSLGQSQAGPGFNSLGKSQTEQHQSAAVEPRRKRRRERQAMPGLSIPELARHPFFGLHSSADPGSTSHHHMPEGQSHPYTILLIADLHSWCQCLKLSMHLGIHHALHKCSHSVLQTHCYLFFVSSSILGGWCPCLQGHSCNSYTCVCCLVA